MDSEKKVDMQDLIERGKTKGSLSNNDILEAIDFTDYDIDQLEKLYETLESNGIEVTSVGSSSLTRDQTWAPCIGSSES